MSEQAVSVDGLPGEDSPGEPGEYFGRPTRRLETAHCWVEVLAEGGPRVVRFGLAGGENLFAETPTASWDGDHGTYELLGGHRFWFAPESDDCSVPDTTGLTLSAIPDATRAADAGRRGVRLVGAVEAPTGLRKTVEVRLDPDSAAMSLRHVLTNEGSRTLEIAPWPITQLRLGGVAVVPLPPGDEEPSRRPNQLVVLWPYASGADARLRIDDHRLTVTARPDRPMKVGCLSSTGTAGYFIDGLLVVLRFDPSRRSVHADLGCNLEIYCDDRTIELESLGPLETLAPGESVTHDERWEIREARDLDVAGADALLRRLASE
jgi:hypothetical protein